MQVPPEIILEIARLVKSNGGRALLVGGCVRDSLLGKKVKDWDVEVYGIPAKKLEHLLRELGPVNAVGKSFGVFKLASCIGEIDVSIPRRDSNSGPGHRGIHVEGDPHMSVKEAARRRDLTVNAILEDPLTGERLDPFDGQKDLHARVLRAVDADTFLEDPLRAVRVVQFAARLESHPDKALFQLCRDAALAELPAERIREEWIKLLVRGTKPSIGFEFAHRANILERVFAFVDYTPRIGENLDQFAQSHRHELSGEGRQLGAMLACWLWDSSDPMSFLDKLELHSWAQYRVRDNVLAWVLEPHGLPRSDAELRHLSTHVEVAPFLRLMQVCEGADEAPPWRSRAEELGVSYTRPEPLLQGRDLIQQGVKPGPQMGELLKSLYHEQLEGQLTTKSEALEWVGRQLTT